MYHTDLMWHKECIDCTYTKIEGTREREKQNKSTKILVCDDKYDIIIYTDINDVMMLPILSMSKRGGKRKRTNR